LRGGEKKEKKANWLYLAWKEITFTTVLFFIIHPSDHHLLDQLLLNLFWCLFFIIKRVGCLVCILVHGWSSFLHDDLLLFWMIFCFVFSSCWGVIFFSYRGIVVNSFSWSIGVGESKNKLNG
jgi:hypothetical protein